MGKRNLFKFIKQYKVQFIGAFINSLAPVLGYTIYKFAFVINRLKFDLFPELPWEERAPLIEQARSEQIVKTIIVSLVIIAVVYFPLLLLRFRVDLKERFFDALEKFKNEDTDK